MLFWFRFVCVDSKLLCECLRLLIYPVGVALNFRQYCTHCAEENMSLKKEYVGMLNTKGP